MTSGTLRSKALIAFASFTFLIVVVLNACGWFLWRYSRDLLHETLDRHLVNVALRVARELPGEVIATFHEGDEGSEAYQVLQDVLERERVNLKMADMYVLDAENRVLLSPTEVVPIGMPSPALEIDRDPILDAWQGRVTTSQLIQSRGNLLKTAYAPVRDRQGTVVALLAAEADFGFYDTLGLFRNALLLTGAVGLWLVIFMGYLARRLFDAVLEAQEQSEENERLALMGRLAAQVTHEIRNPLSIISSTAEYLGKQLSRPDANRERLNELFQFIIGEIERLNAIINRFLSLARPPGIHPVPTTLNAVCSPLVELSRRDLSEAEIELSMQLGDLGEQPILADPEALRSVVLNCFLNARDAMEEEPSPHRIELAAEKKDDSMGLRIRDTGTGFTPEVLRDACEPLVTTKAKGSGLGLYVARRIMREHGGRLDIENQDGGGAQVTLWLPLAGPPVLSLDGAEGLQPKSEE